MHRRSISSISLLLFLTAGCAGPLAVQDFSVVPEVVAVGQSSFLSVTVSGPYEKVQSVVAVVREVQDYDFTLSNDATYGDAIAGDNIWSITIPVPMEADSGVYHLDLYVRDVDGNLIGQKGVELPESGIAGTVEVTVR